MWAPDITLSIYIWFLDTVLYNYFQRSFSHYKLKFIILKSYEHLKLIESSNQLNPAKSFRTHFYSDYFVSCQGAMSGVIVGYILYCICLYEKPGRGFHITTEESCVGHQKGFWALEDLGNDGYEMENLPCAYPYLL